MKKIVWLLMAFMLFAGNVFAEDPLNPVDSIFERLDELMIRVESGISLNSYAESLAELKIAYKKAAQSNSYINNPLLSDRMKPVLKALDDYAVVWSIFANDGEKNTRQIPIDILVRYKVQGCFKQNREETISYNVGCIKSFIYDDMTSKLASARSAHENGW